MDCRRNEIVVFFLFAGLLPCYGVSWLQQLKHIARRRMENRGQSNKLNSGRRSFYSYDPKEASEILGAPTHPSHLPEAEPILPGHTLIRPSLGMLKSSIKFPHMDLEDGSGVYGNIENLGLKYDGLNERLLYTRFRRTPSDYVMVVPEKKTMYKSKPSFRLLSTVVDLENKYSIKKLLNHLQKRNLSRNANIIILATLNKDSPHMSLLDKSYYLYRPVKPIRYNKISKESQESRTAEQSLESEHENDVPIDNSLIKKNDYKQKLISMINAQNQYNRIKFSDNAPDYDTFIPARVTKNLRDWWFFNQDDYKTLNVV